MDDSLHIIALCFNSATGSHAINSNRVRKFVHLLHSYFNLHSHSRSVYRCQVTARRFSGVRYKRVRIVGARY